MKDIKVGVKKWLEIVVKLKKRGTLYFCQNKAFNFWLSSYYSLKLCCENYSIRDNHGTEFVVPFFSGSCCLTTLKLSSKSHQMTPFFIQNEDWEQNDVVLIKTLLFCKLNRYHLMTFWWQLKSERTRARGKRNRKSRAHICWTTSFIYQSKFP